MIDCAVNFCFELSSCGVFKVKHLMVDPEEKDVSRRATNSKGKASKSKESGTTGRKEKIEYLAVLDPASKRRYLDKTKLIILTFTKLIKRTGVRMKITYWQQITQV